MIKKIKEGSSFNIQIYEYYCDTIEEMGIIEKEHRPPMGSSCFCFEDTGVYLVNGKGKFQKI